MLLSFHTPENNPVEESIKEDFSGYVTYEFPRKGILTGTSASVNVKV